MEAYQIILTDRDPQNLHEERRDPQLESQETILNERIMNMLKIMSHDIREPLISISATLKLLSRGYYGKMDEGVANNMKDLLSKTVGLIEITEEHMGSISSQKDYTKTRRDIGYEAKEDGLWPGKL